MKTNFCTNCGASEFEIDDARGIKKCAFCHSVFDLSNEEKVSDLKGKQADLQAELKQALPLLIQAWTAYKKKQTIILVVSGIFIFTPLIPIALIIFIVTAVIFRRKFHEYEKARVKADPEFAAEYQEKIAIKEKKANDKQQIKVARAQAIASQPRSTSTRNSGTTRKYTQSNCLIHDWYRTGKHIGKNTISYHYKCRKCGTTKTDSVQRYY
ncbi:hypothetical protein [Lactococcus sp.]|uniref:hypothetical protein n=1 Tax=Lactococcus sp. TaxID=44273 RepID=UPI0035B48166